MSSSALPSQGCVLGVGDTASPIVYTTIGDVTSFSGPSGSKGEIDTTDVAATAKTFLGSLPDLGTISVSFNYIPTDTQHAQLRSDFLSATSVSRRYQITYSDSPQSTQSFDGYVQSFSVDVGVDAALVASSEIRITASY